MRREADDPLRRTRQRHAHAEIVAHGQLGASDGGREDRHRECGEAASRHGCQRTPANTVAPPVE